MLKRRLQVSTSTKYSGLGQMRQLKVNKEYDEHLSLIYGGTNRSCGHE
jgi:hypothetical protein